MELCWTCWTCRRLQTPTSRPRSDQIRDTLLQAKEQELFGLFMTNLRDQMEKSGKIKINQQELKTLTHPEGEPGM